MFQNMTRVPKSFEEALIKMARQEPKASTLDQMKIAETLGSDSIADESGKRKVCSPDRPMPAGDGRRWAHTRAIEIADYGDARRMKCETCGKEWTEELPQ